MGDFDRSLLFNKALLCGLFLPLHGHAQDLRIGYVDMKQVLDEAPQVVAGRTQLENEFRERNDAIEMECETQGSLTVAGGAIPGELALHAEIGEAGKQAAWIAGPELRVGGGLR